MSVFGAIVWWWLYPVFSNLSTTLPGGGAGDNVTFVWNLWWMRYVLHHPGLSFFSTSFLFYPVGSDLTLHTHTALPALIAALFGPSSLLASQNLLIAGHLALNFVCSYALAYRLTRRPPAAFVGAFVFGASPFVGAHLAGHFNLIAAWIVPLVILLWDRACETRSSLRVILSGASLGAAAYVDYYLFVYAAVLLAVLWTARAARFVPAPMTPAWMPRVVAAIGVLLALDIVLIAAILLTRTDRIAIGPLQVSLRTVSNPVTAAWILILGGAGVWIWARTRVKVRVPDVRALRSAALAGGVALLVILPLVVKGAALWGTGRYVSQEYRWRSAPAGIDAATLVLGNPSNRWGGAPVRAAYARMHIDPVESGGWIPMGALVLVATAVGRRRRDAWIGEWMTAGCVFGVWALGPWFMAFGRQTPLVLPGILVRYVPVVANARMPGRAMVVVYLAVAILTASAIAWLLARGGTARILAWSCSMLIAVDCIPASPEIFVPKIPAGYSSLTGRSGAVCELPLGLRDGFGEIGRFDSMVLLHQTVHERPIVGGFVARLPATVTRQYLAMPVIGTFLRLSAGGKLADEGRLDPPDGTSQLKAAGIAYVIVDVRTAPPDLLQYVDSGLQLRLTGEEQWRRFYEVP